MPLAAGLLYYIREVLHGSVKVTIPRPSRGSGIGSRREPVRMLQVHHGDVDRFPPGWRWPAFVSHRTSQ